MRAARVFLVASLLAASVSAAAQAAAPDPFAGRFENGRYSNDFFRMTFQLSPEWYPSTNWIVPEGTSRRQRDKAEYWQGFHQRNYLLIILMNQRQFDSRHWPPETGIEGDNGRGDLPGEAYEEIAVRALPVPGGDLVAVRQSEIELLRRGTQDFRIAELPTIYSGVAFTRVDYRTQGNEIDRIYHTVFLAIRNGHILSFRFRCARYPNRLKQMVDTVMQSLRFEAMPPPAAKPTP